MKYKAIIYDLDGTLLDTIAMNMYPLIKVIKEQTGIEKTYDEVKHYFSYTGIKVMEDLGFDYESVYPTWVKYVNEYPEPAKPFDGVYELLEEVKKRGYIQAVVSSKALKQYLIDVDEKLDAYMQIKVLEEDTAEHKPSPAPFLCALEKLHLNKDEVLYVGDAIVDKRGCENAGIDFVWANWIGLEHEELSTCTMITHPLQLLDLLEE